MLALQISNTSDLNYFKSSSFDPLNISSNASSGLHPLATSFDSFLAPSAIDADSRSCFFMSIVFPEKEDCGIKSLEIKSSLSNNSFFR